MTEFCPQHENMAKKIDDIHTDTAAIRHCLQGDLQNPEHGVMSRIAELERCAAEFKVAKGAVTKTVLAWVERGLLYVVAAAWGYSQVR